MPPAIPILDLRAQFRSIRDEVMREIEKACDDQAFILGPKIDEFERRLREITGAKFAVSCASGSDALLLPLVAKRFNPGAEVVTTPFTFFATAGAVHRAGLRPVFADIDPDTFNLDPAAAEAALSPRTQAIIPVHLYGRSADMAAFARMAKSRRLFLLEDAAQSFSARALGKVTGALGDAGALSFFPSKNLGAFGDAGAVLTNDGDLAAEMLRLRVHGQGAGQYLHHSIGWNSRMDALQAAILTVKLRHIDAWTATRRHRAARWTRVLSERGLAEHVRLPSAPRADEHVWHQYVIRTPRRDALQKHLESLSISTRVYYPLPLHLQPCFRDLGYHEGAFPKAERAAREVLALPIFPELTDAEQDRTAEEMALFFRGEGRGEGQ